MHQINVLLFIIYTITYCHDVSSFHIAIIFNPTHSRLLHRIWLQITNKTLVNLKMHISARKQDITTDLGYHLIS